MALTIANLSLSTALVTLPIVGAWHADVRATPQQGTDPVVLSGQVTLELDGLTLVGTVVRSAPEDGMIAARIVGGAGGFGLTLAARYYRGSPTVRRIVEDLLRDCGETLDADSDSAVLATALGTWQRASEPAGAALTRILAAHGGSWRVNPAGTVLIVGAEAWPTVEPEHTLVPGTEGASGSVRVAWPDGTPADVLPGITFRGSQIRYVVHELAPDGLRTELRTENPGGFIDRLRSKLSVDAWFARMWPAVVEAQNADGSIDVVVANRFGLTAVPIRHGIPGLTVLVPQGHRVLVGFEAADPRAPYAALWATSGTAKLGTLLLAQNASSLALLPPQWFAAGTAGNAAAAAALAAVTGAGNIGYLQELTSPIVEVT